MSISIPNLHNSSKTRVSGSAEVFILARQSGAITGTFRVEINATFDPLAADYPSGTVIIRPNMTDSANGVYTATSIELINSFGRDTPVAFLTGRCRAEVAGGAAPPIGCKYWIMLANNK